MLEGSTLFKVESPFLGEGRTLAKMGFIIGSVISSLVLAWAAPFISAIVPFLLFHQQILSVEPEQSPDLGSIAAMVLWLGTFLIIVALLFYAAKKFPNFRLTFKLAVVWWLLLAVGFTAEAFNFFESKTEKSVPTTSSRTATTSDEKNLSKEEKCYEEATKVNCPQGTACMHNPASAFCTCMGGTLSNENISEGQRGLCTIEDKTYDEWEYFDTMKPKD